jgi:hypothetical protein
MPLDAPPWRGHAETREEIMRFGTQAEPTTPLLKGGRFHPILPLAAPTEDTKEETSLLLQAYLMWW